MKQGEIWVATLEPKKGAEVGKQRPIIIAQTDLLNDVEHPTVLIFPVSSKVQKENALRYKVINSCFTKGIGFVLIDQLRAIDVQLRLKRKIGSLKDSEILELKKLIIQVLD
jgi:mRNA interferase MazF